MAVAGALLCLFFEMSGRAQTNPILFVTQVPIPTEVNDNSVSNVFCSVVSAQGNHLADTAHAGRGGDLWIRFPNGAISNLTRLAGFGMTGAQHGSGISVRDPAVYWSGTKAIFSMVVGAPVSPTDTNQFYWQLYEITNFVTQGSTPIITKVSNQPTNYNNIMPCYGTDGRIIFASDRPRNGDRALYPQLDEYTDFPCNSGLWSLDANSGDLFLLDHSPSGSFTPTVDSFGRIIFTRWDHLVQDRNATDDRMGRATNGTFNYFSEISGAYNLTNRPFETFPEPRTYDTNLLALFGVQGNAFNLFLPWMINEDGTAMELLNHVGRHELAQSFRGSSFTNDPNLVQTFNLTPGSRFNTNYLNNFFHIREDPTHPGTYFGIDAPDFGNHAAGQILTLFGPPGTNGEQMFIKYITPKSTVNPNAAGIYRNPLPMTDGSLVAAYSSGTVVAANIGTAAFPKSPHNFRLSKMLPSVNGLWTNAQFFTSGITNPMTYWKGSTLITYTNALWELEPVEVVARPIPARQNALVAAIEAQVFSEEGVTISEMQSWLRSNDLALVISRNLTARDRADKEQPYNLRVPGGVQTVSTNGGKIYDVSAIQFLQADQLRGLTFGTTNPVAGRRVLAVPLHDSNSIAFNLPVTNGVAATQLGLDGSQATFLPARRGITHQTLDTNGNHVVRERYWITYQPGEIRTCAVCHGLNVADQAGNGVATNAPFALRLLLRNWRDQTTPLKLISAFATNGNIHVNASGPSRRTNVLEISGDLQTWIATQTNISTTNQFYFDDPQIFGVSNRFYRLKNP
ncbi:MAG: hypothetical protein ABI042_07845 [Verrucomicrobiota bacterium]